MFLVLLTMALLRVKGVDQGRIGRGPVSLGGNRACLTLPSASHIPEPAAHSGLTGILQAFQTRLAGDPEFLH